MGTHMTYPITNDVHEVVQIVREVRTQIRSSYHGGVTGFNPTAAPEKTKETRENEMAIVIVCFFALGALFGFCLAKLMGV